MDELYIKILKDIQHLLNNGLYDECFKLTEITIIKIEEGSFGLDEDFSDFQDFSDDEEYEDDSYYEDYYSDED
jgi:hypothetical protein